MRALSATLALLAFSTTRAGATEHVGSSARATPDGQAEANSQGEAASASSSPRPGVFARGAYVNLWGGAGYGRGLRLNNPFRLATPVGSEPDALSLTAPYLDLSLAALFGPPRALQHGVVTRLSLALTGVPQEVWSLGYMAAHAWGSSAFGYARASLPLVLRPDLTAGGELALGGVYWVRAGLGLSAELSGAVFAGAATWESDPTLIPILSLALGACFQYEVLP